MSMNFTAQNGSQTCELSGRNAYLSIAFAPQALTKTTKCCFFVGVENLLPNGSQATKMDHTHTLAMRKSTPSCFEISAVKVLLDFFDQKITKKVTSSKSDLFKIGRTYDVMIM